MTAADGTKDMDALIEDYLEGRLSGTEKDRFEAKLRADKEFRARVETTTRSIELVRAALVKVDPGGNFEDEVSSKILSITQSNPNLRPFRASDAGLPSVKGGKDDGDPDRKLFKDPQADQEQKRLMGLAVIAAILFAAGVGLIVAAALSRSKTPPVKPAVSTPNDPPKK